MVAKFSSSSRLNCMRCDLNSASASMSLITPAIALSSPAETFEFGGKLIEADRDDVRVLSDPAGSDVLDPAVVGHLDAAVPDDSEYGGGQRRQPAVGFPVPVRGGLGPPPEDRRARESRGTPRSTARSAARALPISPAGMTLVMRPSRSPYLIQTALPSWMRRSLAALASPASCSRSASLRTSSQSPCSTSLPPS